MLQTFIWDNLGVTEEVKNTRSKLDTLFNNYRRTDLGMLEALLHLNVFKDTLSLKIKRRFANQVCANALIPIKNLCDLRILKFYWRVMMKCRPVLSCAILCSGLNSVSWELSHQNCNKSKGIEKPVPCWVLVAKSLYK